MSRASLRGRRVLITSGPTRERLDPVRFLTNASTGRMGFALAEAARSLGARVTVVTGPTGLAAPRGCSTVRVETAAQMLREVLRRWRSADAFIAAAAVGDWRFARTSARKIPKGVRPMTVRLVPNPDILAEVSRRAARAPGPGPVLVGFALETHRWLEGAKAKLRRKGLDLVVANTTRALGAERSRVALVARDGSVERLSPRSKRRVAEAVLRRATQALAGSRAARREAESRPPRAAEAP